MGFLAQNQPKFPEMQMRAELQFSLHGMILQLSIPCASPHGGKFKDRRIVVTLGPSEELIQHQPMDPGCGKFIREIGMCDMLSEVAVRDR